MRILRKNPVARAIATLLLLAVFALIGALPAAAAPELPPPPPYSMMGDVYAIGGVTAAVPHSQLDLVHKPCHNTMGLGSEDFLSTDCGKLLVGPDFDQSLIDKSGGAIERLNELNHFGLPFLADAQVQLPEGGFTWFSMGYGDLRVRIDRPDIGMQRDIYLHLAGAPNHGYHILFRGAYGDAKTPHDRNSNIIVSNFEAGNVEVQIYPGKPNGGWVSQGHIEQKLNTALSGSNNCGDGGCPRMTLIMVDVNTEAVLVLYVTRNADGTLHFAPAWSNYQV